MTEHYFTARPRTPHEETEFTAVLRGMELRFRTDRAVFSRERVDPGTRLLAEAMRIGPADIVLDLGCGYGVLGIVAGRLAPHGRVYMVDRNERAARLAGANAERNGVRNAEVRVGDGTGPVAGIRFDVILMNPPVRAGKAEVHRLVAEAGQALAPGGSLWVVIGNKQGAPSLKRHLRAVFRELEDVDRKGGYHVYRVEGWRAVPRDDTIDAGPGPK